MPLDASGPPTSPDNIPKYDPDADAPSGLGLNAIVDAIQAAITARLGGNVTNQTLPGRLKINDNSLSDLYLGGRYATGSGFIKAYLGGGVYWDPSDSLWHNPAFGGNNGWAVWGVDAAGNMALYADAATGNVSRTYSEASWAALRKVVWASNGSLTIGNTAFAIDANNYRVSLGGGFSGSGNMVFFFANTNLAPSSNPTGGVQLYAESGVLKSRDPSGNVMTLSGPSGGGGSTIPAGTVVDYAGSSAPTGWLMADGSAVSRTTYADLFTAIGITYGAGDGSTTFNLPDGRGRVAVGKGTHTDVDALTDNDGLAVGSRTPKHTHNVSISDNANAGTGGGQPTGVPGTYATTSAGPAYLVLNKIIKT